MKSIKTSLPHTPQFPVACSFCLPSRSTVCKTDVTRWNCSVLARQVLAQKVIFRPHRLEPTEAVLLRHASRRAAKACRELVPPHPCKEQILYFYAGQPCSAVPKWVTSTFPNAEKIPLGVDRPVPGARAKFSKAKGPVMSWGLPW